MKRFRHARILYPIFFQFLSFLILGITLFPNQSEAATVTKIQKITKDGQTSIIRFAGLLKAQGNITVKVDIYGDFGSTSEYADVLSIDTVKPSTTARRFPGPSNGKDCNTTLEKDKTTKSFIVPASLLSDGILVITVKNSAAVSGTYCSKGEIVVTLNYPSAKAPDLQVADFKTPSLGFPSQIITATYKVKNTGTLDAKSFRVYFYYNKTSSQTTGLQYLTYVVIPSLAVGKTTALLTRSLKLPATATTGTRYISMFVDRTNLVKESNEGNNNKVLPIKIGKPNTPDLQIDFLSASPTTIKAGEKLTIKYRVTNAGQGTVSNAKTRFYLSTNDFISIGDTYLKHEHTGTLAPGVFLPSKTTTYTAVVTIPASASIGTQYIGAFIDFSKKVSEVDESNNKRTFKITVKANPNLPDLQVDFLSATPTTALAGAKITIKYRLYNAGKTAAANVKTRLYLSTNSIINTRDTYLGHENTKTLAAGAYLPSKTTTYSAVVTIPASTRAGTRYIGALIDYNTKVAEGNESNNTKAFKITVKIGPQPDLQVHFLSATSTTVAAGAKITVKYRLYNAGKASAANVKTRLYLSTNTIITTFADTYLNHESTKTLAAGVYLPSKTTTYTAIVTIPASTKTGTQYIGALTDYNTKITEGNERNNTRAFKITVTAGSQPDLRVEFLSATPTTVTAGTKITIKYRLYNAGTATAANVKTRLYLSTNNIIDTRDTYLGHENTKTLAAGVYLPSKTTTYTAVVTIPKAVVGIRYVGAFVDYDKKIAESNEGNNTKELRITVKTSTLQADLQVHFLSATPTSVLQGSKITIMYRLYNAGKATATNVKTRLYLSTNSRITTTDAYLGHEKTTTLAAGAYLPSKTTTYTAVVTVSTFPGTRYIGAIIDYNRAIKESNESNNTKFFEIAVKEAPLADLYMWSMSFPRTVVRGGKIQVDFKIRNSGPVDSKAFRVNFYYGSSSSQTNLVNLGQYNVTAGLAAKSSSPTYTINVTIPANATTGNRRLHYFIDSTKLIREGNETNNRSSRSIRVSTASKKVDLLSALLVAPATSDPGKTARITYQIKNAGTADAGRFRVSFYYAETTSTTQNILFRTSATILSLKAGATTAKLYVNILIPNNASVGKRYIQMHIDKGNSIPESDETNNHGLRAIQINKTIKAELSMASFTAPTSASQGDRITLAFSVKNTGTADAKRFYVSFYFSNDAASTGSYMTRSSIPSLAKGVTSSVIKVSVDLPASAAIGKRYIHYYIDSTRAINELDEQNNRGFRAMNITASTLPDLQFSSFSVSPLSVPQSGKITLKYQIYNAGKTAATNVKTRFYASTNTIITTLDTYLSHERVSTLAAGAKSPVYTVVISLPIGVTPKTWYIGGLSDWDTKVKEADESNNTSYKRITVTVNQGIPDLAVSYLIASPSTLSSGSKVTVKYRLQNLGGATAKNVKARLYFSRDRTITTTDIYLNHEKVVTIAGKSYSPSTTAVYTFVATIPTGALPGTSYIGMIVDYDKKITEGSESNNTRSTAIKIAGADLQVLGLSISPKTVTQGGKVTVKYRLYNAGSATATNVKTRIYYSTNSFISTFDTYLGSEQVTTIPGNSYKPSKTGFYSAVIYLPANATVGVAYIGALTDYDTKIKETNENNNYAFAKVTATAAKTKDLQVSITVTPSFGKPGTKVNIRYQIANRGTEATGAFKVRLYQSKDQTITTSDTYMGVERSFAKLDAGKLSTIYSVSYTIPANTPAGKIYAGAIVDFDNKVKESNETNNTNSAEFTVLSSSAKSDLQVSFLSVTPLTAGQGGRITIRFRVYNAGSLPVSGALLRLYFSMDSSITTNDSYLGYEARVNVSGKSYVPSQTTTATAFVNLPANAAVGARFVGAIIDYNDKFKESNESNNTRSTPLKVNKASTIDLRPSILSISPKSSLPGGKITVTYQVQNDGNQAAADFKTRLYFSTNNYISISDTYLNIEKTTKLASGAKTAIYKSVITLPSSATSSGFIGVLADFDTKIKEVNESNNFLAVPVSIDAPDLQIGKVTLSSTRAAPGGKVTVTFDVLNAGKADAINVKVRLYLSTNNIISTGDTYLSIEKTVSVKAGKTSTQTAVVTIPATTKLGSYHLGALADYNTKIGESNENNNYKSSPITIAKSGTEKPKEVITEKPKTDAGTKPDQPIKDVPPATCYTQGCPPGQICKQEKCQTDPCAAVKCNVGTFCSEGKCIKVCGCKQCSTGQKCEDGACIADSCANTNCSSGKVCDSKSGKCILDPCSNVTCGSKRTCKAGKCIDDICGYITCPNGTTCNNGQCLGTNCAERTENGEGGEGGENPTDTVVDTGKEQAVDTGKEQTVDTGKEQTVDTGKEQAVDTGKEQAVDTGKEQAVDTGKEQTVDTGKEQVNEPVVTPDDGGSIDQNTGGGTDKTPEGSSDQSVGGGCGCQLSNSSRGTTAAFFGLLFFLLPVIRRRRRKAIK